MPKHSVIGGVLHPVLQNTTRFKKKILGEKEKDLDGKPSNEWLFENADKNAVTKAAKIVLQTWLNDCNGKGPRAELERAKRLDEMAKKHGIDRNLKYYRAEIDNDDLIKGATVYRQMAGQDPRNPIYKGMAVKKMADQSASERRKFVNDLVQDFKKVYSAYHTFDPKGNKSAGKEKEVAEWLEEFRSFVLPDWKKLTKTNDEIVDFSEFVPWAFKERVALLSSLGGQSDCVVSSHVDLTTGPKYGLGLHNAEITLRIDVREMICFFSVPQSITKRKGDKGIGYQNVSGNGIPAGAIDFYARNLVSALAARDIQLPPNVPNDLLMVTHSAMTYPDIISNELGLKHGVIPGRGLHG
ncbi:hypothetical protein BDW74DRAFT_178217 [Aspergillus multicolor]|uniref:uncharacterized protein n=1 Tax=Aspergillus multicolor TaxID=41759 RepID=UPI003CCCC2B1